MPQVKVVFYKDNSGQSPVVEWLRELRRRDSKGFAKCVARIQRLALLGYELRRPEADSLRDGIHELRTRRGHVNYRILYFFHGQTVAVLCHALTKEDKVPDTDIDRALRYKEAFERNPQGHMYEEELANGQDR